MGAHRLAFGAISDALGVPVAEQYASVLVAWADELGLLS